MAIYKTEPSDYELVKIEGKEHSLLSSAAGDRFNASLLGLGELKEPAVSTDAIAAVFDWKDLQISANKLNLSLLFPSF